MILFLDDDPNRAALMYQRMNAKDQSNTIWCQTAEEAIKTLQDYSDKLILVTLDHDLEGQIYMHPDSEKSGMEVVRWLESLAKKKTEKFEDYKDIYFKIHSHNEFSSPEMESRLKELGLKASWQRFGE